MILRGSYDGWITTYFSFRAAPISVGVGVVIITAPSVPPRTIMPPVTCARSRMFPPSNARPPIIAPRPTRRPATVPRSREERAALLLAMTGLRACRDHSQSWKLADDSPAITHDSADNLFRRFEHSIVVATGQRDDCVRR